MSATSRALGALALAACLALSALPAQAAPAEDPAPSANSPSANSPSATSATTPSAQVTPDPVVKPRSGDITVPDFATKGWVLADLDTGEILAMQDPDRRMQPASTLKLLTALTVVPRLSPEQPYRAVKADEQAEGNRVVLYEGLKYTVADLLHAALLPSANDAAEALARANGGIGVTVEQMNAEAQRLGATRTTVKNPSGLDADGQLTTAHDLALIGRAAFANPEIAAYLTLRSVDFPGKREAGKRVVYPIYNHNRMLLDGFPGALGGKSGFTSKAGRTFVGAAERDGRRLIVSLMHIGGNTYTTGEQLLAWGFANAAKLEPVGSLAEPSSPTPVFDRAVLPLPEKGQVPQPRESSDAAAADAPTATTGASGWELPRLGMPTIPMPSPLSVLTLLMAVVAALRARVYWIGHRHRTAWTELDSWARNQARSARRPGPAGRAIGSTEAVEHPPSTSATGDESLVGAQN